MKGLIGSTVASEVVMRWLRIAFNKVLRSKRGSLSNGLAKVEEISQQPTCFGAVPEAAASARHAGSPHDGRNAPRALCSAGAELDQFLETRGM